MRISREKSFAKDMFMTQTHNTPDSPKENEPRTTPWRRRPAFWLVLGLVLGMVLLLLLLRSCAKPPPHEAETVPSTEDAKLDELILLQQAHNNGLEEEIRRLHELLAEDPCTLSGILGRSPENSPVAPGYEHRSESVPMQENARGGENTERVPNAPNNDESGAARTGAATPGETSGGTLPASPAPVSAPPPATVGELMEQATVFVLSDSNDAIGMGSGFFVAPGIIATNSHVVQGPGSAVLVGNKALGGMRRARVIAFSRDESHDYALLRVGDEQAAKVPVLLIADGAKRTERVSAWGFPGFITEIDPRLGALAEGDVTAVPEVVYSEGVVSVVLQHTPPVILHTASLSQGNSGGPLVNAEGVVVGINTFIKKADKSYSQTNIALPGGDLATFMREHGIAASMPNAKEQE